MSAQTPSLPQSELTFHHRVNFISSCPPEMAGVAGAWTQVTTHIAGTIVLAVQAAFNGKELTDDWSRSGRNGFLFMIGWTVLFCAQYFLPDVETGRQVRCSSLYLPPSSCSALRSQI